MSFERGSSQFLVILVIESIPFKLKHGLEHRPNLGDSSSPKDTAESDVQNPQNGDIYQTWSKSDIRNAAELRCVFLIRNALPSLPHPGT